MRRANVPLAPAIIGLILGPMAEQHLRRALAAAEGSWTIFVTRPISAVVLMVAALLVLLPALLRRSLSKRP
jgi:putative tricarboxylic transport membrane protein